MMGVPPPLRAGPPPPGGAPPPGSGMPRPPGMVPMMVPPSQQQASGQGAPDGGLPSPGGMAPPMWPPGVSPPPVGGAAAGVVPGYDYGAAVEGMASLSLGTGAGEQLDATQFPRPTGDVPLQPLPGSCDPKYMRMTVNALASSAATRQRFGLPTAVLIQPLASGAPPAPVVNPDGAAIIRCRRCRTYINPFCVFTDGGRRYRCNCCAHLNEVPAEYFCPLDSTGRRRDVAERPELCCGSVEYIAQAEYMVRPPMPPSFFFVLDVSAAAVASGYLPRACATIKACLSRLPGEGRTRVGLLTFDATIQFYALRPGAVGPHVMVVADTAEPFLPCPDDLLVNLEECRSVFEAALDLVPSAAAAAASASSMTPGSVNNCLGPALQAALLAIQHVGGKLLLFSCALPSVGDGKCKQREDARLFGTDREHSLRNPEDGWYKKMAAECSRVQVCVDLWAFGAPYTDLASLSVLPKYTGGDVHHVPGYSDAVHGPRLEAELENNLTRETAWEAVVRVRCSKGFRVVAFHGHFFVRSTDLLGIPAADADKSYAIQIGHEETVAPPGVTYLQCALLHTTSSGERRIRVHTLAVPVVNDLNDVFRAIDGGAMAAMVAKLAIERSYNARLEECRTSCVAKVVTALKEYRTLHPGAARAYGRLVYPDSMALLPLFSLAITKCTALRGGFKDVPTDVRCAAAFDMIAMSPDRLLRLLYPTAYALHLWNWPGPGAQQAPAAGGASAEPSSPPLVPLSGERVDARGWYLLDDGQALLLWVGASAPGDALRDLLGCGSAQEAQHTASQGALRLRPAAPTERGPAAAAAALVARLRAASLPTYLPLTVAIQGGQGDAALFAALVEDRGAGTLSYAEHLLQLHRSVQTAPRT